MTTEIQATDYQQFAQLIKTAESNKDESSVNELVKYAENNSSIFHNNTLNRELEEKILLYLSKSDWEKTTEIQAQLDQVHKQIFESVSNSFIEQILAREIYISYILMLLADAKLERHYDHTSGTAMRRMTAIHSRLCRSIKTLNSIRKIPLELVQININNR
jgi:hypothetical protein